MTLRSHGAAALGALLLLSSAGCLFRSADGPRFFRPASAALDAEGDGTDVTTATGTPIRLGSVRGAPFLRERIVWRASEVEYGLYEQRRWIELPSRYVRRALAATLRTTPGLRLGEEPSAARVDVEVLAFDEVLSPSHEAHVALNAIVRDGGRKRLDRTFTARVPIADANGAATAESMGRALDEVVAQVATAAASTLAAKPASPKRSR